ncbi:apoptosis-inducing factor 1, mitochondrial isoform X2 [Zootermopsis nevadensis]|uniref:apoptosis-inducing factor 1, mitochondrial isoform X2 n=1 Tax=Zootermopsis nevadensis TaxID=136037 RepID=UPI000B8E3528|nr:apoptosis-inducing factor 1, mitochondrial isoform X2 [Zootermopsis nevadensis]
MTTLLIGKVFTTQGSKHLIHTQPQYFIRLYDSGTDDGKDGTMKIVRPYLNIRTYTTNSKGAKGGSCKSPETTKAMEEHVKCKDTDTSKQTQRECTQSKVTGPPKEPSEKECKPVMPITPQKADIKPAAEYKSQSPVGQPPVSKLIPSEQESSKPHKMKNVIQQDSPGDTSGKQKKYGRQLIGGLLLLASAFAAYFTVFTKEDAEGKRVKFGGKNVPKSKKPRKIIKFPAESKDIPNTVPYLLIGGGTASFAAFRAIKTADPTAKVLVIDNEGYYPYMRPPLSKEMWFNDDVEATKKLRFKQWNGSERSLFYEPEDFYVDCTELATRPNGGVAIARGWTVKKLNALERKAILEDGYEISYKKCLIATGSTALNLPLFEDSSQDVKEKVTLFRGIFDFEELEDVIESGSKSVAVIGGGFLGSELACSIARQFYKTGLTVHQIFPESGNMGKVLPEYLSLWTANKLKEEGVNVITNAEVEDVKNIKDQLVLSLNNGSKIKADHVIVAVGAYPNTDLARSSDLELDEEHGGFLVNAELMARTDIWSAGDCTCFYDVKLGRRRVEHHDHAVVSGRLAGENMTGAGKPYLHQSMFWSDLSPDVGYEAIGIVDSALSTVGVFAKGTDSDVPKTVTDESNEAKTEAEPQPESPASGVLELPKHGNNYGKGVIFYLRDDIIVGIVMWNLFNRMSVARQILKEEKKYSDLNEVAKLFNIHDE